MVRENGVSGTTVSMKTLTAPQDTASSCASRYRLS
jgi:hypothetical protein